MLILKEANFTDIEAEWRFVRAVPADENGFTNGNHGISRKDFDAALHRMIAFSHGEGLPEGWVPETFYFLWKEHEIVGEFRIRHYLTEELMLGAGHIGYYIAPEHRGCGYAKEGLRQTLAKAAKIVPEEEILLRVRKNNPASLRVMLACGGEIYREDETQNYVRFKK